jgi:hypothetical protein
MGMPSFMIVAESLKTAKAMLDAFLTLRSEAERQQLIIDLQAKVLEAQRAAQAAAEFDAGMTDEFIRMQEELDAIKLVGELHRDRGLYYIEGDPDPFCPRCYEVQWVRVHLVNPQRTRQGQRWTCANCQGQFIEQGAGKGQ